MSEKIMLKAPHPYEFVEPEVAGVDPRIMGRMYYNLRKDYPDEFPDGMDLVRAEMRNPELYTYGEIIEKYAMLCDDPDFSDRAFFYEHFIPPPRDETSHEAVPGQPLEEYVDEKLLELVMSKDEQGHFGIGLPEDSPAAGVGRFSGEPYHWDSYHIALGYAEMGEWDKVAEILYNTEYEINTYGHPLNGGSKFYATRAQPDYFGHMIRLMADKVGPEALVRFLPALEKDHMGYWMDGKDTLPNDSEENAHRTLVRMPDGSFLNRYWDDANGPRLESYFEDMRTAEAATEGLEGKKREKAMHRIFKHIRAAAASGWDFSSRWFKNGKDLETINAADIVPVDLNSLLAYNEETLAMAYEAAAELGHEEYSREECIERAKQYRKMAEQRVEAINTYLWDDEAGMYRDYNFADSHRTDTISAATVYPLYVGIASPKQAVGVANVVEEHLLHSGGVVVSTTEDSGEQWDGKNVWAPPQWAAVKGLGRAAHMLAKLEDGAADRLFTLAEKTKDNYLSGIRTYFRKHRAVPEKHRGDTPEVPANGGEYELVSLLGMSLGVFRALLNHNPRDPETRPSLAEVAMIRTAYPVLETQATDLVARG